MLYHNYMRAFVSKTIFLLAILLLLSSSFAASSNRETLTITGILKTPDGNFLNGDYNIDFNIINSSNVTVYDENHNGYQAPRVSISNGYFSVTLGDTNVIPVSLFNGSDYNLAVNVNSNGWMNPSMRLTSVASSITSVRANDFNIVNDLNVVGSLKLKSTSTIQIDGSAGASGKYLKSTGTGIAWDTPSVGSSDVNGTDIAPLNVFISRDLNVGNDINLGQDSKLNFHTQKYAVSPYVPAGSNILENSSFETWTTDDFGYAIPTGWHRSYLIPSIFQDTNAANVHSGNSALKLMQFETSNISTSVTSYTASGLNIGDTYELDFWIKRDDVNSSERTSMGISVLNKNWKDNPTKIWDFNNNQWIDLTVESWDLDSTYVDVVNLSTTYAHLNSTAADVNNPTVPATGTLSIMLDLDFGDTNDSIYLDDVNLQQEGTTDNVITNSGFEEWNTNFLGDNEPVDWNIIYYDPFGPAEVSQDTNLSNVNSGSSAVKLKFGIYGQYAGLTYLSTGLTPGADYNFIANSKRDDVNSDESVILAFIALNNPFGSATKIWNWTNQIWETYFPGQLNNTQINFLGPLSLTYTSGSASITGPTDGNIFMWLVLSKVLAISDNDANTIYLDDVNIFTNPVAATYSDATLITFNSDYPDANLTFTDWIFRFMTGNGTIRFGMKGDGSFYTDANDFNFSAKTLVANDINVNTITLRNISLASGVTDLNLQPALVIVGDANVIANNSYALSGRTGIAKLATINDFNWGDSVNPFWTVPSGAALYLTEIIFSPTDVNVVPVFSPTDVNVVPGSMPFLSATLSCGAFFDSNILVGGVAVDYNVGKFTRLLNSTNSNFICNSGKPLRVQISPVDLNVYELKYRIDLFGFLRYD